MVRGYILTERERRIIQAYLKDRTKLEGFAIVLHYLKSYKATLLEDFEMIEQFLSKQKA